MRSSGTFKDIASEFSAPGDTLAFKRAIEEIEIEIEMEVGVTTTVDVECAEYGIGKAHHEHGEDLEFGVS